MLSTPRRGLRPRITAAERSELPSSLNADEELNRVPNQSGSLTDPCQLLGALKQVIIECHCGSHAYLHPQHSTAGIIS